MARSKAIFAALLLICLSLAQEVEDYADTEHANQKEEQNYPPRCPALYPPSSPYVEMPIPSLCAAGVPVGTRCSIGCVSGFELVGSCSRVCQEAGAWSGQEAQCISRLARCPSLGLGPNVLSGQEYPVIPPPGQLLPGQLLDQQPGGQRPGLSASQQNNNEGIGDKNPNNDNKADTVSLSTAGAGNNQNNQGEQTTHSPPNSTPEETDSLEPRGRNGSVSQPQLQPPPQYPAQFPGDNALIPAAVVDPLSCLEFAGAICRFTCPDFTSPVSSLNIVCQQSGQWSQPLPMCQRQSQTPATPFPPTSPPTPYPTPYPTPFPTQYPTPYPPTPYPPTPYPPTPYPPSYPPNWTLYPTPPPTPYPPTQYPPPNPPNWTPYPTAPPTPYPPTPYPPTYPPNWPSYPTPATPYPPSSCSDLSAPTSGSLYGSCVRASVGQSCFFTCFAGYTLVGAERTTCIATGWTVNPPICLPVNRPPSPCPTLIAPQYGSIQGSCSDAAVGQTCAFTCQPPFRLSGTAILACTPIGWTSRAPVCESTGVTQPPVCPPLSIQYGSVTGFSGGSGAVVGQSCYFSCQQGYTLNGPQSLYCTPSGWSGTVPVCVPISTPFPSPCPALQQPPFGQAQGSCVNAQPGQLCYFSCGPGYTLNGPPSLTCTPNGWTPYQPPTCQAMSTYPPTQPPSQQPCPNLPMPSNGQAQGTCYNAQAGQSCYFSCSSGFTLNGPSSLTCTPNGWSPNQPPSCQPISTIPPTQPTPPQQGCPYLPAPQNGQAQGTCYNAQPGQSCFFTCNPGFRLVGSNSLTCTGPQGWSGPPPYCQPDSIIPTPPATPPPGTRPPATTACFDLNPPTFGYVRGSCVNVNVGESCYYSCAAGYGIVGMPRLTCGPAGWSSQAPVCLPIICPNITRIENGVLTGSCAPGSSTQSCTLTCNPGFKLAGGQQEGIQTFTLVCQENSQWNGQFPGCTPITCPALPDTIPNGNAVQGTFCSPGEALKLCQYQCNPGFYVSGSATIICQLSGRWSSDVPVCNRITCRSLFATTTTILKGQCDPGYSGFTCEVACAPRYEPRKPTVLTCLANATYDVDPPECKRIQCASLPPISNAQKLDSDNPALLSNCNPPLAGSRCIINCNPGYWTETDHVTQYAVACSDEGAWAGNIQNCVPITCPPLLAPSSGVLDGNCYDATVQQKCTFRCERNFFGMGEGVCNPDGKWSSPFDQPIMCLRKTCPDWNITAVISNGYMEGLGCANVTRPGIAGEYCIYRCEDGYALRGNPYIRCVDDNIDDPLGRFDPVSDYISTVRIDNAVFRHPIRLRPTHQNACSSSVPDPSLLQ